MEKIDNPKNRSYVISVFNKMKSNYLKYTLFALTIGVWGIFLQNLGVIPTVQKVEVKNRVDIYGSVDIDNTVDVKGEVGVYGDVDVDIKKINGWNAANHYSYSIDGKEFHSLGSN